MGRPLSRRETHDRQHQVSITADETRAEAEQRRASLGYLFWPAALYEHYLEREPASAWYRQQVRQALGFGIRAAIWGAGALLWPLVLSLLLGNLTATVILYIIAIVIDIVLFAAWLKRALQYAKRASRGETFALKSPAGATRGIPVKH